MMTVTFVTFACWLYIIFQNIVNCLNFALETIWSILYKDSFLNSARKKMETSLDLRTQNYLTIIKRYICLQIAVIKWEMQYK